MSVAGSVAIAVAERVERTGGARAGLVVWKALAGSSTDIDVRGKAILAALRCALAAGDVAAIDELAVAWEGVTTGVWDGPIASLCREMVRAGLLPRATALARAEARRHPTARSLYCHARCLDLERDPSAPDAFRDALTRAENEGASEIGLASRVRRATILSRSWHTMSEALEEASRVDVSRVPAASRIAVARVLLRSPSRFTRATALGILDDVVVREDPLLARRALSTIARWVDDVGEVLTPLEEDRLVALLGRERASAMAPRGCDVVRALARIAKAPDDASLSAAIEDATSISPELAPLQIRARDILRGRFETLRDVPSAPPSSVTDRLVHRHAELLDVVVAMRDRAPDRAMRSLRMLADAEEAGEPLPAAVFRVACTALTYGDDELRAIAARIVAARLSRVRGATIPGGFVGLADTLSGLGMTALSLTARRAAVVAKEPGAAESLGLWLAREGWDLARAGDRAQAIAKLREAKALLDLKA